MDQPEGILFYGHKPQHSGESALSKVNIRLAVIRIQRQLSELLQTDFMTYVTKASAIEVVTDVLQWHVDQKAIKSFAVKLLGEYTHCIFQKGTKSNSIQLVYTDRVEVKSVSSKYMSRRRAKILLKAFAKYESSKTKLDVALNPSTQIAQVAVEDTPVHTQLQTNKRELP